MDYRNLASQFDEYSLKARLQPGLYLLLPLILTVWVWATAVVDMVGALLSLFVICGTFLVLAQVIRRLGKKKEAYLLKKWGAWPTTYMLRHHDHTIDSATKSRYRNLISKLYPGEWLSPSRDDEMRDPQAADEAYRAAGTWLISKTRDTRAFPLVFKENVSYGFRRNLLGVKPIGISVAIICAFLNAIGLSGAFDFVLPTSNAHATAALVFCAICATVWIVVIDERFVQEAGEAYALQLLSTVDQLSARGLRHRLDQQ